jgi:hypothetical protein
MTASDARAHETIPPDRATYHHTCDRTRAAYWRAELSCRGSSCAVQAPVPARGPRL